MEVLLLERDAVYLLVSCGIPPGQYICRKPQGMDPSSVRAAL
jgi:hypothetical protein